jgi:hypothetical protein
VNLTLVVPGLLAPSFAGPGVAAPGLARLLAASRAPTPVPDGIGAALAPLYGIVRQTDWPLAPIRAAAAGIALGDGYWLAADPVSLAVGAYDVALEGAITDLEPAETTALLATLNTHFAADGLTFVAPAPSAWFVRVPAPPALATQPLAAAARLGLRAAAPTGAAAPTWARWQHEIQMLLHEHPVNAARAVRGRSPVNSVWFADGGVAPQPAARPRPAPLTFAEEGTLAAALATFAGTPRQAPGDGLDAALAAASAARAPSLVVAPGTLELRTCERAWAAPAWRALTRGSLAAVRLVGDGAGAAMVWEARQPGFWDRVRAGWRTPPLATLLARASGPPLGPE